MLRQFYDLALIEGEGLGTAYEYASKHRILKQYLKSKKILIYGLPEKYGFSLDFLYLLDKSGCETHVYEERREKIIQYNNLIKILFKKGFIKRRPLIIDQVKENYDVIFSSEVIQRFDNKKLQNYFINVKSLSKKAVIFFPNGNNKSHCFLTKLKAYKPEYVSNFFVQEEKAGFIDMPPFPPGLKVKSDQMRRDLKFLTPLLYLWLFIEKICPRFIKKRFCHIAYIQTKNEK